MNRSCEARLATLSEESKRTPKEGGQVMVKRGNEVVITVEPVREEAKCRQEEVRTAAKNDGARLRGWFVEEAAWRVAQFIKIATSVAVVRWVHQLFRIGYASESAYQRAPDLWSHGHQEKDPRFRASGYTQRNTTWKPSTGDTPSSGGESSGFDQRPDGHDADSPRYVATVEGGYHLYLHRRILNPGRQFWPCPLLYVSTCNTCSFLEYDSVGMPQCVALWKLKALLENADCGETLDEIRESIRNN